MSANSGENSASTSVGEWLSISGFVSVAGGRPRSARSRYHGFATNRVARFASQADDPQKAGPRPRNLFEKNSSGGSTGRSWAEKKNSGVWIVEAQAIPVFSATSRAAS